MNYLFLIFLIYLFCIINFFNICKKIQKLVIYYPALINKLFEIIEKIYILTLNTKFSIINYTKNIYEICYNNQNENFIIFISGGGFLINAPCALIVGSRILPKLTQKKVSIITIKYSIHTNYKIIQKEILESYNKIIKMNKNIICLMGDSAGANLILSLTNKIKPVPICLISPWLNMVNNYTTNDDIIDYDTLEYATKIYVNNLERSNKIVSPYYFNDNDIKNIEKSLILVGSREIFLNDITTFYKRLINSKLVIYKNKYHGFYLLEDLFYQNNEFYNDIINFILLL
jgi:hypothetical protein